MIKVLHIGEYVSGGVAIYLKTLIEEAEESDVEHYLLMSSYKSDKDWKIDMNKITFYSYKRNFIRSLTAMFCIYFHIKKVQPDIIHIHSTWAGVLVRIPYLLLRKKEKIIYTPHGWSFLMEVSTYKRKLYIFMEKILSSVTNEIVNISKYEQIESIKKGLPSSKMSVIYNGVKYGNKKKRIIRFYKNKINLLFVGRLDRQKGLDIFLKYYYQEDFPYLHLYVIGKSILEEKTIKTDNKTTYLGWIDNEELDSYYEACDVVIMPSRWEGFGLVAIEAMRNGKPIIASNRGALPELIKNEIHGYIFNLDNPNELKNILTNLDKKDLKKMGKAAIKRYTMFFTAEKMKRDVHMLYKKTMDTKWIFKN